MKKFDKLSGLNKVLVRLTIVFLIYGYLCRIVGIYFFWESKTIGWTLLFITIISILIQRIKTKKTAFFGGLNDTASALNMFPQ